MSESSESTTLALAETLRLAGTTTAASSSSSESAGAWRLAGICNHTSPVSRREDHASPPRQSRPTEAEDGWPPIESSSIASLSLPGPGVMGVLAAEACLSAEGTDCLGLGLVAELEGRALLLEVEGPRAFFLLAARGVVDEDDGDGRAWDCDDDDDDGAALPKKDRSVCCFLPLDSGSVDLAILGRGEVRGGTRETSAAVAASRQFAALSFRNANFFYFLGLLFSHTNSTFTLVLHASSCSTCSPFVSNPSRPSASRWGPGPLRRSDVVALDRTRSRTKSRRQGFHWDVQGWKQ